MSLLQQNSTPFFFLISQVQNRLLSRQKRPQRALWAADTIRAFYGPRRQKRRRGLSQVTTSETRNANPPALVQPFQTALQQIESASDRKISFGEEFPNI